MAMSMRPSGQSRRSPSSSSLALLAVLSLTLLSGAARAQSTHVVRPGETLWDISRQHMSTPLRWPELQRGNAVPVPEHLKPGQILKLAGGTAVATVVELSGNAWLKRGTAAPRALAQGAAVWANDVVMTDRGAFLSLGLGDGSRLVMPSSSAVQVMVANGRVTRLQLLDGRVEAHVEKQRGREFEIRNRTAGLAVRGTHFRARNEEGVTTAEVIEGAVAVSSADRPALLLAAASGTLLEGPGALQAQPLLPPPQNAQQGGAQTSVVPVTGATGYRMQLARDDRFLQLTYEQRSKQGDFALPADLQPGFYHLRLTAFDARQLEGMPGDSIVYIGVPAAQAGVRRMDDGRYEISWPARPGQRFAFELARTPAFAPALVSEPALYSGGALVGPLEVPGRYYWRSREITTPGAEAMVFEGSFDVPAQPLKNP